MTLTMNRRKLRFRCLTETLDLRLFPHEITSNNQNKADHRSPTTAKIMRWECENPVRDEISQRDGESKNSQRN